MLRVSRKFLFLLFALLTLTLATPVWAVTILVEWEGVAESHWTSAGEEAISLMLHGSLSIDTDLAAAARDVGVLSVTPTSILGAVSDNRLPIVLWDINLDSPSTAEQALALAIYAPGSCAAFCSFSWDDSGALSFSGSRDPHEGDMGIASDGTGTFSTGWRYTGAPGVGRISGTITSSRITVGNVAPIPEPSTATLFAAGLLLLARRGVLRS